MANVEDNKLGAEYNPDALLTVLNEIKTLLAQIEVNTESV